MNTSENIEVQIRVAIELTVAVKWPCLVYGAAYVSVLDAGWLRAELLSVTGPVYVPFKGPS